MKKLFLLIIIFTLNLFAQGWWNNINTIDEINDPEKHEIFANSSGIHILTRTASGVITYYKLNSEGDVQTTYTLETSNADFPNIVGSNDKIYAVYRTVNSNNENVIRVKYSIDNGSSWLTDIEDKQTTARECNGVEAVYDPNNGVHIVWATKDYNHGAAFETYYRRLAPNNSWPEFKTVTDYTPTETGGNPNITFSPNRVHVSFNTDASSTIYGYGDAITRDKVNGIWQDPQIVVSGTAQSIEERLIVRGNYLYLFYNCRFSPSSAYDLKYKTKPLSSNSWTDYPAIESGLFWTTKDAFEVTKTKNDSIHIIYKMNNEVDWFYARKSYGGTN